MNIKFMFNKILVSLFLSLFVSCATMNQVKDDYVMMTLDKPSTIYVSISSKNKVMVYGGVLKYGKTDARTEIQCLDTNIFLTGNITELNVLDNHSITSIDVSNCKSIKKLYCGNNKINNLSLGSAKNLEVLICHSNKLTEVNLKGLKNLRVFWCHGNKLKELNFSDCKVIKTIRCYDNKIRQAEMDRMLKTLPKNNKGVAIIRKKSNNPGNELPHNSNILKAKLKGWCILDSYDNLIIGL